MTTKQFAARIGQAILVLLVTYTVAPAVRAASKSRLSNSWRGSAVPTAVG